MEKFNPHIQKLADDCAREDGSYFCASYIGRIEGRLNIVATVWNGTTFVFRATFEDSCPRTVGLPVLILVQGEEAFPVIGTESFKVLDQIRVCNTFRKGQRLFKKHQDRAEDGSLSSEEREYSRTIVDACLPAEYCNPVEKRTMYEYLEIAERFHKKIEIVTESDNTELVGGWSYYYIKLI